MTKPFIINFLVALVLGGLFFWCISLAPVRAAECQRATVSWYGMETCIKGRTCKTANGTPFNGNQMVVAHRTMAFGTKLRFTHAGKSVVVRVDDRGPFVAGRTFDLSKAAFAKLAHPDKGVIRACWERVR